MALTIRSRTSHVPKWEIDDQADSTPQALNWFKRRAFLSDVQQYTKEQAMIANCQRGLI